jgi:hypothetical protein
MVTRRAHAPFLRGHLGTNVGLQKNKYLNAQLSRTAKSTTVQVPSHGCLAGAIGPSSSTREYWGMENISKPRVSGSAVSKMRVTKKLARTDRGAIKIAQQFGESVVCVRHRTDPEARHRYTTVELLVEAAEMQPRQQKMVHIRVNPKEYGLQAAVRAAGGVWDHRVRLWRLPKRVATVLRLTARVVEPK